MGAGGEASGKARYRDWSARRKSRTLRPEPRARRGA